MTTESILLIARDAGNRRDVLETHATRLDQRTDVDSVETVFYDHEPVRELRAQLAKLSAETVYTVPTCVAHDHATLTDIPGVLSYISGKVYYCDPIGQNDAITSVIERRARDVASPDDDVSLVIVGFGSSSKPYQRETADYHAARLREHTAYESVLTCYYLQNPSVECVRYNVETNRAVAVPLFLSRTEATEKQIPDALELERGGIGYADPLGTHPQVTDAIHATIEKRRALASSDTAQSSFGGQLSQRPLATDGDGR